jgi:hypothetical protein
MTTGTQIMNRAAVLLNDATHIRWPCSELCEWINEAVRAIVLAKPSACSKTVTLRLRLGSRQSIDPQTLIPVVPLAATNAYATTYASGVYPLTLIAVIRNVNSKLVDAAGKDIPAGTTAPPDARWVATTPGRMVKLVDRALLEAQVPDWHNPAVTQTRAEARNYTFDETVPFEFYVYPPNNGAGFVEAEVGTLPQQLAAKVPTPNPSALTLTSNNVALYAADLGLPEPYSVPLLDYVLYRCQMKDDIDGAAGRSAMHYQQFATAIGLKIQVEKSHSPNARSA